MQFDITCHNSAPLLLVHWQSDLLSTGPEPQSNIQPHTSTTCLPRYQAASPAARSCREAASYLFPTFWSWSSETKQRASTSTCKAKLQIPGPDLQICILDLGMNQMKRQDVYEDTNRSLIKARIGLSTDEVLSELSLSHSFVRLDLSRLETWTP